MTNKSDRFINARADTLLPGILILWLALTGIASVFVMVSGVPLPAVLVSAGLCVFPVILTLLVAVAGRDWPRGRRAMLVSLPWTLMAAGFIALSGGLSSPALVFAAFPPLVALAFGWNWLAVESAVFSLIATVAAVGLPMVAGGLPVFAVLSEASEMYAFAGLCAVPFIVAGLAVREAGEAARMNTRLQRETTREVRPAPVSGPAAGLDPIEPEAGNDGDAIIDVTREGRIRSASGDPPAGLAFRPGRVFIEAFPGDVREAVAGRIASGGTFRQRLETGETVEVTVDRHDLGMRVFIGEAEAVEGAARAGAGRPAGDAEARAAAAEAELAERTAFFAGLGHELKTPLNAILGFSDLMRTELRGPLPEAYKDYSELIHESGQDLLLVVEDILDYARAEAGHARLDLEPVDLVASAESVVAQLSGQAQRAGVRVKLDAGGEVWAKADARAVRQIWQNLLSNAVKYSASGDTVTLRAREGRHAVALSVRDQGAGMDAEDLDRIARPFQQGRNAKGRAGTGLGLAVVQSFAKAMRGKVVIDTAPGAGTRVRVLLPKADARDISKFEDAAQ